MDDGHFARVDDGAELAGAAAHPFAVRRSAVIPIVGCRQNESDPHFQPHTLIGGNNRSWDPAFSCYDDRGTPAVPRRRSASPGISWCGRKAEPIDNAAVIAWFARLVRSPGFGASVPATR
jgi:hypothetical protein